MKRRLLPWILSVSLCLSLLPAGSFSAEGESQMACSCTQYCPEAGTDETCMVCINDPANCTGKGTAAFSETPEIMETLESAEGQSDWESEEQFETEPVTVEVSVESEEETPESSEPEADFQEPPSEEVPGEESEETEKTNKTEETEASGETEGIEEETEETATEESSAQSEGINPTLEEIQELIYSLPGAEEMESLSAEEKEAVYAKVQEIRSMLEGLTEEERALLDTTRLEGFLMQTAEKKAKTLRVGDVAEIISADGSRSYASSLQAAIDSAPDGATIKLLQSTTENITIYSGTFTLDGNNCSVGNIGIEGGTIDIQNLAGEGKTFHVAGGTVNVWSDIIHLTCDGGIVNVYNGIVSYLNCYGGTVNIWNGSVGHLRINGGIVNILDGTVTDLGCSGGEVNVAGGRIDSLEGDGGTVNYYAIDIWLNDTAVSMIRWDTKTLSANVHTEYSRVSATPPIKWESSDTNVVEVDTSGKITAVSTGEATITASVQKMDSPGVTSTLNASCTVTVEDGVKLSVEASEGGKAYINTDYDYTVEDGEGKDGYYLNGKQVTVTATAEEGYCFVGWKDKNGGTVSDKSTYEFNIQEDTELTAVFQKGVARVTHNGTTSMYATLEKAFDAAEDGATIELLDNNTDHITIGSSKTLTLDGKGFSAGNLRIHGGTIDIHNLTGEGLDVSGGTVSISGSSVGSLSCSGSGTVSISGGSVDNLLCYDNGKVEITSGSVESILSCSGSGTVSITGSSVLGILSCTDSGTVSITRSSVKGLRCYDSGEVNILSGEVSSLNCSSGEVNILSGEVS
ncbi:MAG: Ig-like domain-containing protein, partial [Eubacteriales bacterium]|nr:Ig-like domain-containing protein [Eubacteriales bacterium]